MKYKKISIFAIMLLLVGCNTVFTSNGEISDTSVSIEDSIENIDSNPISDIGSNTSGDNPISIIGGSDSTDSAGKDSATDDSQNTGIIEENYQYFIQEDSNADRTFMRTPYIPNMESDAPANYYESIRGRKGDSLKSGLKGIISNPRTNYDWSRFEIVDEDPFDSSSVFLIYPRTSYKKTAHVNGSAPHCWNKEHTYPQSKLTGNSKSDTHLIFADDWKTNGTRSNYVYGVVPHNNSTKVLDSAGRLTANWKSGNVFEPCDAAKGEVARATLYTNLLYGNSLGGNFANVDTLFEWHNEFPVTSWEILRNNRNYKEQGNRNPFIDHPEFAQMIFDSKYSGDGALNDTGKANVTSIKLDTTNVKKEFEVFETFSSTGLSIKVDYDDGSSKNVQVGFKTNFDGVTFNESQIGNQIVSVSYGELTQTYQINVKPSTRVLVDIEINTANVKKTFMVGETFSSQKLVITGKFDNNMSSPLTNFVTNFDKHVFTSAELGEQTVTVTCEGFNKTYKITIIEKTLENTIEFTPTDFGAYQSSEKEMIKGGIAFNHIYVMNQSGSIQLKNGQGYIYNKTSMNRIQSIEIKVVKGTALVYGGNDILSTSGAGTEIVGVDGGEVTTYNFAANYSHFFLKCQSGSVLNLDYIKITYAS